MKLSSSVIVRVKIQHLKEDVEGDLRKEDVVNVDGNALWVKGPQ